MILTMKKMPPAKTKHVPRFGSQSVSSQRNEPGVDQAESSTRLHKEKRRSKLSKTAQEKTNRPAFKVKMPKLKPTLVIKLNEHGTTPPKNARKAANDKTKMTGEKRQDISRANPAPALTDGDVFFFSERSDTNPTNEKEKAQLSVLRTISKMLEENQLIRERLAALSQGI